jgi:hypothetical protein
MSPERFAHLVLRRPSEHHRYTVLSGPRRPGCWHSTWLGPMQRSVHEFVASRDGADIVLDTTHDDGREMRWRFTDITERSFSWSNATRIGDEWVVTQRFAATRAGSVPTPP